MGGLTYVLFGLQPALSRLMGGLGSSGLRFTVTLGRILDVTAVGPASAADGVAGAGYELALRQVTFAYGPHSEPVLNRLDLVVPQGDHLAIVGPSGIGKSTLAGLLCGLLRPGSGSILVGGAPIAGRTPGRRARTCVLIPQEAYVFTGSLWENLSYLRPDARSHEIHAAIQAIGAGKLVAQIGGLSAQVDPAMLSAGERQLISLVRAYLSEAPIAVLDEATCHLDPAADRRAELAFADRPGTLIVVAHRISSALRAKRILVLDGPRATIGDHASLTETCQLYRALLRHWGSDPAGLLGDPDRLDPGAPAGLGQDPRQMIANGAVAEKHLRRDVPGGEAGIG
jgi:ATP-binding cassette subfamily C protein